MKKFLAIVILLISVSGATKALAYETNFPVTGTGGVASINMSSGVSPCALVLDVHQIQGNASCGIMSGINWNTAPYTYYQAAASGTIIRTLSGASCDIATANNNTGSTTPLSVYTSYGCDVGIFQKIGNGSIISLYPYFNPLDDTSTRIIYMAPENGTTTGNSVTFTLEAYINQFDQARGIGVKIYLHNIDQNVLLIGSLSPSDIVLYDSVAPSAGYFTFSTTTSIADGNYRLYANLAGTYGVIFGIPFGDGCGALGGFLNSICLEASTQFIVNQSTFIGNIAQNSFAQMNNLFASTSATSTANLANRCNVLAVFSTFDVTQCLAFLFVPDQGYLSDSINNFKDNVSTHFPLGYLTDFITILSTTTQSSLTVIDATVPSILPGGGSHVHLDLSNVLDPALNATTSQFMSQGASSTQTLYEITSRYWNYVVYLMAGLYLLRRIIGSHLIPGFGGGKKTSKHIIHDN